jgi:hypothetical protein
MAHILSDSDDRDISFQAILTRLRTRWHVIGLCPALIVLAALLWLIVVTPLYRVEMVVSPPLLSDNREATSAFGGLGSGIAGLGVDLPSTTTVVAFQRYLVILRSEALARRLESEHHVLSLLLHQRWDATTGTWKSPSGLRFDFKRAVYGFYKWPLVTDPTIEDLVSYLQTRVAIDRSAGNPPVRVLTFYFDDPQTAANILLWLHETADGLVKEQEINRSTKEVAYIEKKLAVVTEQEHRSALTELLFQEEQRMMRLNSDNDYSAVIVDRPMPPVQIGYPRFGLVVEIAAFGGFILGMLLALVLPQRKRHYAAVRPRVAEL